MLKHQWLRHGPIPQPTDRQGPRGFGYVVLTIVVIGGIVYGLNSLLHKESKTPPPQIQNAITNPVAPPTVSKDKLDQLRIGMSLAQVESVLVKGSWRLKAKQPATCTRSIPGEKT